MQRVTKVIVALAVLLLAATPAWAKKHKKKGEEGPPVVLIKTSVGDIQVQFDPKAAPGTVANFLRYVDEGFYNGTIFHRVIPGFMIQGGGMDSKLNEKETHEPIKNESNNGLLNKRGTISMARRPNPDSATAQFFINVADNSSLDYPGGGGGYTVFGHVISGMDVVDKIVAAPTTSAPNGMENVPIDPIVIQSITLVKPEGSK